MRGNDRRHITERRHVIAQASIKGHKCAIKTSSRLTDEIINLLVLIYRRSQ